MRITDLKRNDVPGAVALYREMVLAGEWRPEYASTIMRLHSDAGALMEAMAKESKTPEMAKALKAGRP